MKLNSIIGFFIGKAPRLRTQRFIFCGTGRSIARR
jgi:hypothetical protein